MQGELTQQTLADTIRTLYVGRKSGIVHLSKGGVHKRIYFKKGSMIFANSDVETDRLGEFLIRSGMIDREIFAKASERMKQTGHRFGRTLVELGCCDAETMESKVVGQIEAIIYSLFDWHEGQYRFEQHEDPVDQDIVLNLSTADIILEGIRRMDDMETIRRAVGDTNGVLSPAENPLLLFQQLNSLSSEEGFIHSRCDGSSSIADIMAISPLGEDETLRCIYGLVSAGVLEFSGATRPEASVSRGPVAEVATVPPPPSKPAAKAPLPPERVAPMPSPPPPTPAPQPVNAEVPKPEPAAPLSGSAAAPEGPSPEELAVREDIVHKHASLADGSLYELLGITQAANETEVKKAYYLMAKKYHPDRHHSPHLQEVHHMLEELFVKITHAYQTLSAPLDRRRYDSSLKDKGAKTPEQEEAQKAADDVAEAATKRSAEDRFREGKRHFDEEAFFDAIQSFREAVRLNPDKIQYRKLLAQALMKNPKWMKEAEEHFQAALKIDQFDAECHFGLGLLYEQKGMTTRAQKYYQQAATYDPDNPDIQEKLGDKKSLGALAGIKRIFGRKKS